MVKFLSRRGIRVHKSINNIWNTISNKIYALPMSTDHSYMTVYIPSSYVMWMISFIFMLLMDFGGFEYQDLSYGS